MKASICFPSSLPLLSPKTSSFPATLFPPKQNILSNNNVIKHCLTIKAAASNAPQADYGNVLVDESLSHHIKEEEMRSGGIVESENVPMVALDCMQHAKGTLEDFVRSYFMFHDMDPTSPHAIFEHLPLIYFTESYIYQLDAINEKLVHFPFAETSEFTFKKLAALLEKYGMYSDRVKQQFKYGEEYWALERKLCSALASKQEGTDVPVEEVLKAIRLKSFDYRVMNIMLYQLNGKEVNDLHMDFLAVAEFLVEIADDIFDYEADVLENNFNVLRMYVKIYGAAAAPTMLKNTLQEAEDKYRHLQSKLDPQLALKYQKRREEDTKEGWKVIGSTVGTWNIPPIIEDEDLYRYEMSNGRRAEANN